MYYISTLNNLQILRLVNHLNDQDLEKVKHREYVVYLVPTGPLLSELNSFMASSIEQCGRNGAHKTFPHTTLCMFFTVSLFYLSLLY